MPVTINNIDKLQLTENDFMIAIEIARFQKFSNNLRDRKPTVIFDSRVRGAVGEIMMLRWLSEHGFMARPDEMSTMDGNGNVDVKIGIDMGDELYEYTGEVKTSLLGGHTQSMQYELNNYDLIVQRKHDDFRDDLTRDIHMQILYGTSRADRDNFVGANEQWFDDMWEQITRPNANGEILQALYQKITPDISITDEELADIYKRNNESMLSEKLKRDIYNIFDFQKLADNTYFAGWTTSIEIVDYLTSLPPEQQTWGVKDFFRGYWHMPFTQAYAPGVLPGFLSEKMQEREMRALNSHRHERATLGEREKRDITKPMRYEKRKETVSQGL